MDTVVGGTKFALAAVMETFVQMVKPGLLVI
jgi:hypothetical protein